MCLHSIGHELWVHFWPHTGYFKRFTLLLVYELHKHTKRFYYTVIPYTAVLWFLQSNPSDHFGGIMFGSVPWQRRLCHVKRLSGDNWMYPLVLVHLPWVYPAFCPVTAKISPRMKRVLKVDDWDGLKNNMAKLLNIGVDKPRAVLSCTRMLVIDPFGLCGLQDDWMIAIWRVWGWNEHLRGNSKEICWGGCYREEIIPLKCFSKRQNNRECFPSETLLCTWWAVFICSTCQWP